MLVIDGHNLIGKMPGISLESLDDEEQLIHLLQAYARVRRKPLVVFFDQAAPGQAGEHKYGAVTAYFVRADSTADAAIGQYIARQGGAAQNFSVVTSDRMVQANIRKLHAQVISSEEFASQLEAALSEGRKSSGPGPDANVPLGEWYGVFGLDKAQAEAEIPLAAPKKAAGGPAKGERGRAAGKKQAGKARARHGFPSKK